MIQSKHFNASDYVQWATSIDTLTGQWKIEMAIYQPHVNDQSAIAFNLGGSTGSSQSASSLWRCLRILYLAAKRTQ